MENLISDSELLQFALDNGIIDRTTIENQIEMMQREKYLEMHDQDIWQAQDGRWKTYLKSKEGRRLVTSTTQQGLQDKIVSHYKEKVESPTLEKVFYEWHNGRLEYNEISKGTYDKYVNDYKRFFGNSRIKDHKIKTISEDELDLFIRATIAEQELTQKAYANFRTIVRGIFKYAKRKKYTDLSISTFFQDLDLSKRMFKRNKVDAKTQVFQESEIPILLDWLNKHPRVSNYGIILALQTGVRTGELAALKYSDIEGDMLHVQRQEVKYKSDEKGKLVHEIVDNCKTDAGDRYIYLTDSALMTIQKIRFMNPFNEYMMVENGKRINTNVFNGRLKLACEKVGIPVRTMHKLRKTYGTTLIDNGVDESLIMEQMGHKDISTTRKYYYYANKDSESKRKQIENAINF